MSTARSELKSYRVVESDKGATMSNDEMEQVGQALKDLSSQCRKVLRLSNSLEPNIREIAEHTREIPPLSAAVLQTVNSASMGLQRTIHSVDQAVALLGAKRMCDVIEHVLDADDPSNPPTPHLGQRRTNSKRTA